MYNTLLFCGKPVHVILFNGWSIANKLPVGQHFGDSAMVRRTVSKTNEVYFHEVVDLFCAAEMELGTASFGKLLNEMPERPTIYKTKIRWLPFRWYRKN